MKIPVIFHNLRGYDSHFIMQEIVHMAIAKKQNMDIIAIPNKAWVALGKSFHLCRLKNRKFETATGKENF